MLRRFSAFALVAALSLVGAGCTAAGHAGVARAVPPKVLSQAELATALLRAEDLPEGYTLQPIPESPPEESGSGGQGGGVEPCDDVFNQLKGGDPALSAIASGTAEVEFSRGDDGPFLQQGLLSSGDRAGLRSAVDAFRQLPAVCGEFTENDEQGTFTMRLSSAEFPALGDETVAVKLDATGRSEGTAVALGGYLVLIRVGATVCILIHFGIPTVGIGETETVARAAVARLE
jgi:hypothetical protein